jgi:hypothetical protein
MIADLQQAFVGFANCGGYAARDASEVVRRVLPVGFGEAGQRESSVTLPMLTGAVFGEIQKYIDMSIYQIAVGRSLILGDRPTWGLIASYYASFFAAQAAIRFRGVSFAAVGAPSETPRLPLIRLEAENLLNGVFSIKYSRAREGEHRRLWRTFFSLYEHLANSPRWAQFYSVTAFQDSDDRFIEMNRRHRINYELAIGYQEVRTSKELAALMKRLRPDPLENVQESMGDHDSQLESRAFLRLRLCFSLLNRVAEVGGRYAAAHPGICHQRKGLLDRLGCPARLRRNIVDAIEKG